MWLWRGRLRSPLWLCVSHNGSPVLVGFGGNKIHFHQTTKDRRILLIPGIHYFDAHRLQPLCGILRFCPLLPSQRPLSLLLVVFWLVSFVVWCFLSFHAINLPVHLDVRSLELRLLRECFPVCLCFLWCLFDWQGKSSAH